MNITLYYVENISRIDTPWFRTAEHPQGSIEEQAAYFATKKVKDIETSFYPPHYHNTIRFDSEDLTLTTNVNYLSLSYNGKTYYYFIDSIEYITEGLLALNVNMDVIQTYMFNIIVTSGYIERKFINRSVSGIINRDYLRENVSAGLFEDNPKNIINFSNPDDYWMIVKIKETAYENQSRSFATGILDASGKAIIVPYKFVFIPCRKVKSWVISSSVGGSDVPHNTNDLRDIFFKRYSPYIEDCFIIPFSPSENLYVDSNGRLHLNDNNFAFNFTGTVSEQGQSAYPSEYMPNELAEGTAYMSDIIMALTLKYSYQQSSYLWGPSYCFYCDMPTSFRMRSHISFDSIFNFNKNNLLNVLYSSSYMYQLFDENYINFKCGSNSAQSTYPIHRLINNGLYNYTITDINSGIITYYNDILYSTYDRMGTAVDDTNIPYGDIIVDSSSEYVANNRNRYVTAGVQAGIGFADTVATVVSTFYRAFRGLKSLDKYRDKRYTTKDLRDRPFTKRGGDKYESFVESMNNKIAQAPVANTFMPFVGEVIKDDNVKYIPDRVKQVSNFQVKLNDYSFILWSKFDKVLDFEQCAYYYHTNGYLVKEGIISPINNIFDYVQNRYYFNVLKTAESIVHLHDIIEDEDTINEIEERLDTGLRLWNVKKQYVTMGNYQYDNVELYEIEE